MSESSETRKIAMLERISLRSIELFIGTVFMGRSC